jgi:predicted DNA-binding protein with PD1-like motif
MRHISQPGPQASARTVAAVGEGRRFAFQLEPGQRLLDAVTQGFAREGLSSGVMTLNGGALDPFAYVIPAISPTMAHAAFYSSARRPPGLTRLRDGAATFGRRDGVPFLHCHAMWDTADGAPGGGHILTDESVITTAIEVTAIGLRGVEFVATPDAETGFTLFEPVASATTGGRFHALRLRPNQDIGTALEAYCRDHGIISARIHGGVGSLVGARYDDGRGVLSFATEMFIRHGRIVASPTPDDRSELTVALVDSTADLSEGTLRHGDNPILMTLEVALEAE